MSKDGLHEAFWALKVACPQVKDAEIWQALAGLKKKNRADGGA